MFLPCFSEASHIDVAMEWLRQWSYSPKPGLDLLCFCIKNLQNHKEKVTMSPFAVDFGDLSPFQLELRWFWRVVAAEPAIFLRLTGPAEPRGAAWKVGQDWAAVG